MPRFFVDFAAGIGEILPVTGEDALHISKSLRMEAGEPIVLCNGKGTDYRCELVSVSRDIVEARVLDAVLSESEPLERITLYASVSKGDKMDYLIQKSVELGVHAIVPVVSKRCVYLPDEKSEKNRLIRWNKIALEASKQSGRGIIPKIEPFLRFPQALSRAKHSDLRLIAYEQGTLPLGELLESASYATAAIFTGPEGGYEGEEIYAAEQAGIIPISLGKRILRAETAPLCALSILLYQAERNRKKG